MDWQFWLTVASCITADSFAHAFFIIQSVKIRCMYVFMNAWRRQWQPTPVLLPGKSYGRRSLVGYSPWGRTESDKTERLRFHFHFSLSCTGEGNGNPLQCSCLENPRDGGAWWAALYGVSQSRTRLKRLSSSSSSNSVLFSVVYFLFYFSRIYLTHFQYWILAVKITGVYSVFLATPWLLCYKYEYIFYGVTQIIY